MNGSWTRKSVQIARPCYSNSARWLAWLAVVAMWGAAADIGASEEPSDPSPLDEATLRYLPGDCRLFGQVDFEHFLTSTWGRKVVSTSDVYSSLTPLGLKLEQIDRIVMGASALGTNDASRYVLAVHTKEPLTLADSHPMWSSKKLGPQTVWLNNTEKSLAFCLVEEDVVLFGCPETLEEVLKRDGPAEIPAMLVEAQRKFDPKAHAAFALLLSKELIESAFGVPAACELLEGINSVNVEVEFTADPSVRLAVICCNEAAAQQLTGIGKALQAILQLQQVKQPGVRRLVESIELAVDGSVLTARMEWPREFIEFDSPKAAVSLVPNGNGASLLTATPPRALAPACNKPSAGVVAAGAFAAPSYPSSPYALADKPAEPSAAPPSSQPYSPGNLYGASSGYGTSPYGAPPAAAHWQQPTLPLSDVIRLSEAGVDEQVLFRHIRKHQLEAALTADDLILLTEKEVSTAVITALQDLPCREKAEGNAANPYVLPGVPQPATVAPGTNDGAALAPSAAPDVPSNFSNEDAGTLLEAWERMWSENEPRHTEPYRTHGGIM